MEIAGTPVTQVSARTSLGHSGSDGKLMDVISLPCPPWQKPVIVRQRGLEPGARALPPPSPLAEQALAQLRAHGPASVREVAHAVGSLPTSVRNALVGLLQRGVVTRDLCPVRQVLVYRVADAGISARRSVT